METPIPFSDESSELIQLQNDHRFMMYENTMLSEHLMRVVMSRKQSLQLHLERLDQEQEERDAEAEELRPSRTPSRTPDPSKIRFSTAAPARTPQPAASPLSTEEKLEIAEDECRHLEQNRERIRAENERIVDDLRAVLSQAAQQLGEIRKDRVDFTRDVLLLAELGPKGKISADDILRFIQEKLRKKHNLRNSINNKNTKLQHEIKVLEGQFGTKKDLKEVLHAVDFDQLKILNGQLHGRLRDRNSQIRRIKGQVKETVRCSTGTQRELSIAYDKGRKVKQCLEGRIPLIPKTAEAIGTEKVSRDKWHDAVLTALQEQDGPPQPRATDYMRARDRVSRLRKEMNTWFGKVAIAELANKELEKNWRVLQHEMAMQDLVV